MFSKETGKCESVESLSAPSGDAQWFPASRLLPRSSLQSTTGDPSIRAPRQHHLLGWMCASFGHCGPRDQGRAGISRGGAGTRQRSIHVARSGNPHAYRVGVNCACDFLGRARHTLRFAQVRTPRSYLGQHPCTHTLRAGHEPDVPRFQMRDIREYRETRRRFRSDSTNNLSHHFTSRAQCYFVTASCLGERDGTQYLCRAKSSATRDILFSLRRGASDLPIRHFCVNLTSSAE